MPPRISSAERAASRRNWSGPATKHRAGYGSGMNEEGFWIDHVIYGVLDVDAACERLREQFGLGSGPGIHACGIATGEGDIVLR